MEDLRNFEKKIGCLIDRVVSKREWEDIERDMESMYLRIYIITRAIYKEVFQEDSGKSYVDILEIAKYFHINVIDRELNSEQDIFMNEISGFLDEYDYEQGNYQWSIYVNHNIGDISKRYVIAHELSHYILNRSKHSHNTKYCINPLFPTSKEEQICDLMSSFFLMPILMVLEVLDTYIAEKKRNGRTPIDIYDWMRHLAYEMKVPEFLVTTCYQNIRYLGGILYNKELGYAEGKLDDEIKMVKMYKGLFFSDYSC